jgi:hypothetical protein
MWLEYPQQLPEIHQKCVLFCLKEIAFGKWRSKPNSVLLLFLQKTLLQTPETGRFSVFGIEPFLSREAWNDVAPIPW